MEIKENLTPIFIVTDLDWSAKKFANLVYSLQVRKIKKNNSNIQINSIISLIEELIQMTSNNEYWERATFFDIEKVRIELRNLIKFIENPPRKI